MFSFTIYFKSAWRLIRLLTDIGGKFTNEKYLKTAILKSTTKESTKWTADLLE